jgi:hypothetical protein
MKKTVNNHVTNMLFDIKRLQVTYILNTWQIEIFCVCTKFTSDYQSKSEHIGDVIIYCFFVI